MKIISTYIVVSLLFGTFLLITLFPWHPATWLGWLAYFALALPAVVVCEFTGDLLLKKNPVSKAIERRTSQDAFSWARIGYFLVLLLLLIAVLVAINHWFGAT